MRPLRIAFLVLAGAGCSATRLDEMKPHHARIAPVDDERAWSLLSRETPPLPLWARALVESLPRTTAWQLDLDALHRTQNPLGPVLAARIRWEVADANRCAYSKSAAEADLERAGVAREAVERIGMDEELPEDERAAVAFARELTLSASSITDGEAAELIRVLGPDDAVALVHTVAHANFQDRLFLALGLSEEPAGPLPPCAAANGADVAAKAPARVLPELEDDGATSNSRADWTARDYDELRELVAAQKERTARIPPPDPARIARLPRPQRQRIAGSEWGRVSMGYQPVMTMAWYQTMGSFEGEAGLDEVFASSVFWVVTRTNDCFY